MAEVRFRFEDYVLQEFFDDICKELNDLVGETVFQVVIWEFDNGGAEFYVSGVFPKSKEVVVIDSYDYVEDGPFTYYNGFNVYTTGENEAPDEYVSAADPKVKEIIVDLALECITALEDVI